MYNKFMAFEQIEIKVKRINCKKILNIDNAFYW